MTASGSGDVGSLPEADTSSAAAIRHQPLPTARTPIQMDQYRSKLLKNWRPAGLNCKTGKWRNCLASKQKILYGYPVGNAFQLPLFWNSGFTSVACGNLSPP